MLETNITKENKTIKRELEKFYSIWYNCYFLDYDEKGREARYLEALKENGYTLDNLTDLQNRMNVNRKLSMKTKDTYGRPLNETRKMMKKQEEK